MPVDIQATEKLLLSIIVPMCNEEASLDILKAKLLRFQERLHSQYEVEYCLVDDGSTDCTAQLMASAAPAGSSVLCAQHERNRGVGAAIRTGLRMAKGGIVCTIDADCSYSPEDLCILIELVAKGDADVAVASPYHPQGTVVGVQRWRLLLSQQCSRLYRCISPLKLYTYTSIFRAYSRQCVSDLHYESDGFVSAVEVLLCAQGMGYRVREAPMVLHARQRGYSKMRIAGTIAAHLALLRREALGRLTDTVTSPRSIASVGHGSAPHPAQLPSSFSTLEQTNSTN